MTDQPEQLTLDEETETWEAWIASLDRGETPQWLRQLRERMERSDLDGRREDAPKGGP